MDNKHLGPSDADILSQALLSGAFDLAVAFARVHPEAVNATDSSGRHNFVNFFNSSHSSRLEPGEVSSIMDSLFDLGADPFAVQFSGGKPLTVPNCISQWRNGGGRERMLLADLACDIWTGRVSALCRDDPGLAMRGLLFRILHGDFPRDGAMGVVELASLCDPSDPLLESSLELAENRITQAAEHPNAGERERLSKLISNIRAIRESRSIDASAAPSPGKPRPRGV